MFTLTAAVLEITVPEVPHLALKNDGAEDVAEPPGNIDHDTALLLLSMRDIPSIAPLAPAFCCDRLPPKSTVYGAAGREVVDASMVVVTALLFGLVRTNLPVLSKTDDDAWFMNVNPLDNGVVTDDGYGLKPPELDDIAMLDPLGVTFIPAPAVIDRAPVKAFKLVTGAVAATSCLDPLEATYAADAGTTAPFTFDTVGFGYVLDRSPPAAPVGGAPTVVRFPAPSTATLVPSAFTTPVVEDVARFAAMLGVAPPLLVSGADAVTEVTPPPPPAALMTPPVATIVVPSTFTAPNAEALPSGSRAAGIVPLDMFAALVVSVVADGANGVPPVFATTGLG